MALLSEIFEERVAAAMAAPTGVCCHDLIAPSSGPRSPASTSGSTRASSPGCDSLTSGDASCGPISPCNKPSPIENESSTLLQRRGIRAAILCELGVDLSTPSGTHVETPSGVASVGFSALQLMGTRPAPGPHTPAMDASQRSPMNHRAISQMSPTQRLDFKPVTPQINSRISPNCLGSSPGSIGDASLRSPAGSCKASPIGGTSWNNAVASVMATRTAAIASEGGMLAGGMNAIAPPTLAAAIVPCPTSMLRTAGNSPIVAARDASCRDGRPSSAVFRVADATITSPADVANTARIASNGALNQILASSGLAALSSEELAARLRAATPAEYED